MKATLVLATLFVLAFFGAFAWAESDCGSICNDIKTSFAQAKSVGNSQGAFKLLENEKYKACCTTDDDKNMDKIKEKFQAFIDKKYGTEGVTADEENEIAIIVMRHINWKYGSIPASNSVSASAEAPSVAAGGATINGIEASGSGAGAVSGTASEAPAATAQETSTVKGMVKIADGSLRTEGGQLKFDVSSASGKAIENAECIFYSSKDRNGEFIPYPKEYCKGASFRIGASGATPCACADSHADIKDVSLIEVRVNGKTADAQLLYDKEAKVYKITDEGPYKTVREEGGFLKLRLLAVSRTAYVQCNFGSDLNAKADCISTIKVDANSMADCTCDATRIAKDKVQYVSVWPALTEALCLKLSLTRPVNGYCADAYPESIKPSLDQMWTPTAGVPANAPQAISGGGANDASAKAPVITLKSVEASSDSVIAKLVNSGDGTATDLVCYFYDKDGKSLGKSKPQNVGPNLKADCTLTEDRTKKITPGMVCRVDVSTDRIKSFPTHADGCDAAPAVSGSPAEYNPSNYKFSVKSDYHDTKNGLLSLKLGAKTSTLRVRVETKDNKAPGPAKVKCVFDVDGAGEYCHGTVEFTATGAKSNLLLDGSQYCDCNTWSQSAEQTGLVDESRISAVGLYSEDGSVNYEIFLNPAYTPVSAVSGAAGESATIKDFYVQKGVPNRAWALISIPLSLDVQLGDHLVCDFFDKDGKKVFSGTSNTLGSGSKGAEEWCGDWVIGTSLVSITNVQVGLYHATTKTSSSVAQGSAPRKIGFK